MNESRSKKGSQGTYDALSESGHLQPSGHEKLVQGRQIKRPSQPDNRGESRVPAPLFNLLNLDIL
jgi:hypothetical protein